MSYQRAPNPANMLFICCFVKFSTICFPSSRARIMLINLLQSLCFVTYVPLRTGTKNRNAFCGNHFKFTLLPTNYYSKMIVNFNDSLQLRRFFGCPGAKPRKKSPPYVSRLTRQRYLELLNTLVWFLFG